MYFLKKKYGIYFFTSERKEKKYGIHLSFRLSQQHFHFIHHLSVFDTKRHSLFSQREGFHKNVFR